MRNEQISTVQKLVNGDARNLSFLEDESVHLVLTSPPYWNLKKYKDNPNQLGHIDQYEEFLSELEKVWKEVYRVLVPGGRLVCVVGDVCVSRRSFGRHLVFPLHSDICVICRKIGFDNLNPIIWHKSVPPSVPFMPLHALLLFLFMLPVISCQACSKCELSNNRSQLTVSRACLGQRQLPDARDSLISTALASTAAPIHSESSSRSNFG